jgi:hypothetical protein
VTGDWHKICAEEYETAEAESFGALAGWCYGNNETPPKLTEVLTAALRTAFAGAFNHGYEACIGSPPDALSAPSEPVPDRPRVWAMPEIPEDVARLSAVDGDLLAERDDDDPDTWICRSRPSGMTLAILRTRSLLAQYSPLTEVVEEATP